MNIFFLVPIRGIAIQAIRQLLPHESGVSAGRRLGRIEQGWASPPHHGRRNGTGLVVAHDVAEARGVTFARGDRAIIKDLTTTINRGDRVGVIGPNGSGKTTLLNVLGGIYKPTFGRIFFDGEDVTQLRPHRRAQRGIGRTFQSVRLFKGMNVLENIIVGAERLGSEVVLSSIGAEQHCLAALDFVRHFA